MNSEPQSRTKLGEIGESHPAGRIATDKLRAKEIALRLPNRCIAMIVKYEDLTLKEGEAVTLSVPAIDEAELKRSYELKDGSSAVYKLTDKDGGSVGTQTLLSGSDVEPVRYRTRVYSSNINYGRVEGGGVNSEGRYELVRAYPLEGCRFTGWYENKELVSEEESYQFRVEKDRILTAKFEEN